MIPNAFASSLAMANASPCEMLTGSGKISILGWLFSGCFYNDFCHVEISVNTD